MRGGGSPGGSGWASTAALKPSPGQQPTACSGGRFSWRGNSSKQKPPPKRHDIVYTMHPLAVRRIVSISARRRTETLFRALSTTTSPPDFYNVLKVKRTATAEELKAAFHEQGMQELFPSLGRWL